MHTLRRHIINSGFIWISTILQAVPATAQQDSTAPAPTVSYLASYPQQVRNLAIAPGHWSREQWFQMGGAILLTGALIPMDGVLNIPFENWQNNTGAAFGKTGNVVGGLPFQFGLTGAAMGIGLLRHKPAWQHFALDNLQAQLFTGGITWLSKELTHRERPEAGSDNYAWNGPFKGSGHTSFFSGHTSLAFSTATMVFLHSGKKWWVGAVSYTLASAVGISRMQQQKHWASDVVAGALVGTAVSQFIYQQQQKRRNPTARLKPLP